MPARSYFQSSIPDFLRAPQEQVVGAMTQQQAQQGFALEPEQTGAWIAQIQNLKNQLGDITFGDIFFEYSIPRMGKRADVVLLIHGIVFVLEYKTAADSYHRYARDQCLDYALDLKNFHVTSHNRFIVPVLIATDAVAHNNEIVWHTDGVCRPLLANAQSLGALIKSVLAAVIERRSKRDLYGFSESSQDDIEKEDWADGSYKPTPTIIEAAQILYQTHSVEDISRSGADVKNLTQTTNCINEIINKSRHEGRKSICFVTGVPGAGKTLAGLNISTQPFDKKTAEHAVFLSGNGPLVAVLQEALIRDEIQRAKAEQREITRDIAARKIKSFIHNVHHFRDFYISDLNPPSEHVVVFDEAQRAWHEAKLEKFMRRNGRPPLGMSEPAFLMGIMDRKADWATIVCLIGGGQEINDGEAGLVEWFNALETRYPNWDVYHSGQLAHQSYNWGEDLMAKLKKINAFSKEELHLSVSLRSFKAERLSEFVSAIIEGDADKARLIYPQLSKYHLALTRDISNARTWLRQHARGTQRLGLIASSGAIRLKPEGIMVQRELEAEHWFLNGKEDIRSSYYLEDVATEFDIQGLELDWSGVCWDANFRRENNSWAYYNFKGTKWQNVNSTYNRVYLANAYRVLLTRARLGMVIFVPKGDNEDHTRPSHYYDETYEFLKKCGITEL